MAIFTAPTYRLGACLMKGEEVPVTIVVTTPGSRASEGWAAALASQCPQWNVLVWDGRSAVAADYAVVWRPAGAFFKSVTGLRAVFNLGAGVDALLALPEFPVELPVIRLEDAGMGRQMVEYVVHGLVHVSRRFDDYLQQNNDRQWRPLPAIDYAQWPVGVLGLGTIGAQVAQAVASLGYPVNGWSRTPRTLPGVHCFSGPESLSDFLGSTRVLVNVLPLTPETANLLDRQTLGRLLPDAYVINVGRGEHLVDDDLLSLLQNGRLRGALLDVFRTEPLPDGHPFWAHPRIRITPHIAAMTLKQESSRQITRKIASLERGEPVSGLVQRDRGY